MGHGLGRPAQGLTGPLLYVFHEIGRSGSYAQYVPVRMELPTWVRNQHREVLEALGVTEPDREPVVFDRPVLAFPTEPARAVAEPGRLGCRLRDLDLLTEGHRDRAIEVKPGAALPSPSSAATRTSSGSGNSIAS